MGKMLEFLKNLAKISAEIIRKKVFGVYFSDVGGLWFCVKSQYIPVARTLLIVAAILFVGTRVEMVAKAIEKQTATQYQIQMCIDKSEEAARGYATLGRLARAELEAAKEQADATKELAKRVSAGK